MKNAETATGAHPIVATPGYILPGFLHAAGGLRAAGPFDECESAIPARARPTTTGRADRSPESAGTPPTEGQADREEHDGADRRADRLAADEPGGRVADHLRAA